MRDDRLDAVYELRRRRLFGCLALGGVLLLAFAINGWQVTPIWTLFTDREGTFAAGDPYDEWIYATCDGKEQQVTVLMDGRLEGVSGLSSLQNVRFPNWCSDLPTVDNPELAQWQAKLRELQALTMTATSAEPILDAAEAMPISGLYLAPIARWIRDEAHAVSFLDALARRPMRFDHPDAAIVRLRRTNFAGLIGDALDTARRAEVSSAQLERWLASRQITSADQATLKLAGFGSLSADASALALQRLETIRRDRRSDVFLSLAPDLVAQGSEYTALLREKLMTLPQPERSAAAQQLLAFSDQNTEFPIALLSILDRGFGNPDTQLEIFTAIAGRIRDEPDAAILLTRHLKDLSPMQRRLGVNYLLGLDRPGETTFTMSVLGAFGELHPMSRPKFIYSLMQSPQFADRSVQEACMLAIRLQLRGADAEELLSAMVRHPDLDEDLASRIRTEFESQRLSGTFSGRSGVPTR